MIDILELSRYRAPFYLKKYDSFEDYISEQLNIHVHNEELEYIKQNTLSIDSIIMRMNKCTSDSLDFYARLLYHNRTYDVHLKKCLRVLTSRFKAEENKDSKYKIFNNIRLLVNHLDLLSVQDVLEDDILSILIGEYARKKNINFVDVAKGNIPQKFLGYFIFANKLIGDLEGVEKYIEMDIEVLKILAFYEDCQSFLEKILDKDEYIQYYCKECEVDVNLLKKLSYEYLSYSYYLILDLIKDDQETCREKMIGLEEDKLNDIFILFMMNEVFLKTHGDLLRGNLGILLFEDFQRFREARKNILGDEYLSLYDPIDIEKTEEEFARQFDKKEIKEIHFGAIKKLGEFRELDQALYEKYLVMELRGYLEKLDKVSIRHWLNLDEVYFSLVVEKCPILQEFHKSFLVNKKKRSQMAEDLLKGHHKELFLEYLNKRGIYVELRGVEVVDFDFSPEWLKMFIEENYKSFDIKEGEKVRIDLVNKVLEIKKGQVEVIPTRSRDTPSVKKFKESKTIRQVKLEKEDFGILKEALEEEKEIKDFRRFGLLNQFISENIGDIEGCARVASCVVLNQKQFSKFINTLPFVIEDKKILNEFLFHFLRLCRFTLSYSSVENLVVTNQLLIIILGKVGLEDLDGLVEKFRGSHLEEISLGILLRSYSYVLDKKGGVGNSFRKVKDGDISFYYKGGKYIQLKYKDLVIYYCDKDFERYLKILSKMDSGIIKRSRNILKGHLKQEEKKEEENIEEEIYEEKIFKEFPKDPENNLDLILKGVQEGFEIPRYFIFDLFRIINGDNEKIIFEILKALSLDSEIFLFALSRFESYTQEAKIKVVNLIKKVDMKIFIKLCEIIGNEDNLQVLKVLLTFLRDKKAYFPLIESWKNNYKLSKLMVRIYPLSFQDEKFYSSIFENYKYEDEKEMIKEIYQLNLKP